MSQTKSKSNDARQRGTLIEHAFKDSGWEKDRYWVPTTDTLTARIRVKGYLSMEKGRDPGQINTHILDDNAMYRGDAVRVELNDD